MAKKMGVATAVESPDGLAALIAQRSASRNDALVSALEAKYGKSDGDKKSKKQSEKKTKTPAAAAAAAAPAGASKRKTRSG
jgi:hypothetical protein